MATTGRLTCWPATATAATYCSLVVLLAAATLATAATLTNGELLLDTRPAGQTTTPTNSSLADGEPDRLDPGELVCPQRNYATATATAATITKLTERCLMLRVYSRRQADRLAADELDRLARHCACELDALPWASVYDSDPSVRRLANLVEATLARPKYQFQQPAYLWSDTELLVQGVSVYVSTRDYFRRRGRGQLSISLEAERRLRQEPGFRASQFVCAKLIYQDKLGLFQYMENLQRLSAQVFFRLKALNYVIGQTYEASKACKLLLVHKLSDFKLYPDNRNLVVVDAAHLANVSLRDRPFEEALELVNEIEYQHQLSVSGSGQGGEGDADSSSSPPPPSQDLNKINALAYQRINSSSTAGSHDPNDETQTTALAAAAHHSTGARDFDRELKYMSLHLINCKSLAAAAAPAAAAAAAPKWSLERLAAECPMMLDEALPVNWTLRRYPDELLGARRLLTCACQLLLRADTFARLMQLDELQLMARTLSAYLNERSSPAFNEVPLWSLYGWFEEVMQQLVSRGRNQMLARLVRAEAAAAAAAAASGPARARANETYVDIREPQRQHPEGPIHLPVLPVGQRLLLVDKYKKQCLEMARRACNILLFNHSRLLDNEEKQTMKLVRHLDNLKYLAKDPMFVFHLTLQDANLFKLYAMSKMCPPIIS